jgi:hypothetical protein
MARHSVERLVAPLAAGLLVLLALLGLIGTAIRDPRPHDIPVGLVGPSQALQPMTEALAQKVPGVFKFTTYDSEDTARAALDRRDIDGVVVVGGPATSRIIVAGAAGDTATTLIEAVFGAALSAQGPQVPVEVVHPFASGDAHGLILFFLVLATLISTLVVQAAMLARAAGTRGAAWLGVTAVFGVMAGAAGVGAATWIAGGYDTAALVPMGALVALTSFAAGAFVAGSTRLLGPAGLGLSALVIILLDLISSGGPAGSAILPDVYRWMSPWMPAGQLNSALKGTLYFSGEGVAFPVLVISAWLVVGLVLIIISGFVRRPVAESAAASAG